MTWVRRDDHHAINPKIVVLSDRAYRLDDEATQWCSRNLTDGRIPAAHLPTISVRGKKSIADELVAGRRWHRAGDPPCPSKHCTPAGPDGYVIHDYLEYNPTAEKVLKERVAKAERQRRWLEARNAAKSGSKDRPKDAPRDASQDGSRDGPGDASGDASVAPTPSPSPLPKGKRDGDRPEATAARREAAERAADGRTPPPPQDPYPPEDPAAIAADQRRILEQAAETARANANGAARTAAGAAAARAALAERKAR